MGSLQPKISVIVPAYNHAAWIGQALESVFRQSMSEWELIIIDDASSDETWEQILLLTDGRKNSNITTIRHTGNQGAPATINEGLSLARGEYVAILNSDDAWPTDRLAYLYQYVQQSSLDFIGTGLVLWDKSSRLKNASEPDWLRWYQGLFQDWKQHNDFLRTLLRGNFLITTSNFFFRRSVYERMGGFANLRYVHDYEFVLRLYNAGLKMECLWDKALLYYRLHDSNTIREKPLAAIQENMGLLLRVFPGLSKHLNASRLSGLQIQLQDLYRYTHEEWKTTLHHRLTEKEHELFPLIADRDKWVAERDALIHEQAETIIVRENWVADRDGWIKDRDELITHLRSEVNQQLEAIAERESWLTDRDKMISRRDQWVADRDVWVAERDEWIHKQQLKLEDIVADRDRLLNSWSYRVGTLLINPFRLLRNRVRVDEMGEGHA
ncbi:MAG: Putative N-acetylgalactosaminyl-diphosphoundecaprenol glucuronosyltransferase [uncultured Thiotrichaceae bacterium]|uniref:N-acetylgalactosaminyl-diphosphoundecaprenol glucuronosyltransferase n=1 Tax=uncultured Thiotrichaceae bacterium TaxID=298394 RepID=A0A6S6TA83_9GAMM|nr:MAG: Putative N-acetylgalactosaminyl-diphosphoundecaprenol glucuronosyltransferase [uncultured Thiotrichaceae bacterium]